MILMVSKFNENVIDVHELLKQDMKDFVNCHSHFYNYFLIIIWC